MSVTSLKVYFGGGGATLGGEGLDFWTVWVAEEGMKELKFGRLVGKYDTWHADNEMKNKRSM